MGREGQWLDQPTDQAVDVSGWRADEEFGVYPEGARDKALLYSPARSQYAFLVPNHRYLFKHSFRRYPEQFWAEIIAYRIGCLLRVPVPPAFVAYDSDNRACGALIEWFLDYPGATEERYVPGGDIMTSMIPGFERKRGSQHNLKTIESYLSILSRQKKLRGDWRTYWCDMLLFDALIGNTDRHQDNWGLLWTSDRVARLAPVFDNGTSLGHEILAVKMPHFADSKRLANYIERGTHHLRWRVSDANSAHHQGLLVEMLNRYPDLRRRVKTLLAAFDLGVFGSMMEELTKFQLPVPLSVERAQFVC